jgi:hypothetical protein
MNVIALGLNSSFHKTNRYEQSFCAAPDLTRRQKIARRIIKRVFQIREKTPVLGYYCRESEIVAKSFGIVDPIEVDAFRHAWTSADISMRAGRFVSKILGDLNDYLGVFCEIPYTNQDLWNNKTGRRIAKTAKKMKLEREKLPELVKKYFDDGTIMKNPFEDSREYDSFLYRVYKCVHNNLCAPPKTKHPKA